MQKNRITQSVIIGLTTLAAAVIWTGLKNTLFESSNWLWPVIGFFVLLIFLSLNWLLTKSKAILLITLFFVLVSFFFAFGFRIEYLGVLLIAYLILFFGSHRAVREKKARVKIEVAKILKRGLSFTLTGLCLIIVIAYYFSPLAMSGQNEIAIPRPLFDKIISPILAQIEGQVPVAQLAEQFGLNLDGNIEIMSQEIKDNLYEQVNQKINEQSQAYKNYLSIGLAISLFFALKVIGFPFMWLVIFATWIIFKILMATGAVKVQEQAVLKEVIHL